MLSLLWLSHVPLLVTPWTIAHQASLSFSISQSLLKIMSIESVMLSNHLVLCQPFFILPWTFLSIKVFSSESSCHIRWPKYWSFSFRISPSHAYSGLFSIRIDWFDLLAVQGTLRHHNSNAWILWHSTFFMIQLSHLYVTIGKIYLWLYGPLSAKWCLCFLILCLGLS